MSAPFSRSVTPSQARALPEPETVRKRVRLQSALTVLCAGVILLGALYRQLRPIKASDVLSAQTIAGAWELQSLSGQAVGDKSALGILSQHVVLKEGRISGETRLKSQADTTALPFPDESVSAVETEADGTTRVRWNGTYEIVDGKRFSLRIGKAAFLVPAQRDSSSLLLSCDSDLILTSSGAAIYRPVK
jgi:hypothetical protein